MTDYHVSSKSLEQPRKKKKTHTRSVEVDVLFGFSSVHFFFYSLHHGGRSGDNSFFCRRRGERISGSQLTSLDPQGFNAGTPTRGPSLAPREDNK